MAARFVTIAWVPKRGGIAVVVTKSAVVTKVPQ